MGYVMRAYSIFLDSNEVTCAKDMPQITKAIFNYAVELYNKSVTHSLLYTSEMKVVYSLGFDPKPIKLTMPKEFWYEVICSYSIYRSKVLEIVGSPLGGKQINIIKASPIYATADQAIVALERLNQASKPGNKRSKGKSTKVPF